MDKKERFRNVDTNAIEIKRLLKYLLTNGYEFEGIREAFDGKYNYPEEAIASFSKELSYTDKDGNWINDSGIKVSIQFEKRADYEKFEKNEDEDDIYIGQPETFITGLIKKIKDPKYSKGDKTKNNNMKIRPKIIMKTLKNREMKTI
jgi:hypothetical protein